MSQYKSKQQLLNEFWDISDLIPKRRTVRPSGKSTDTVQITSGTDNDIGEENKLSESTLIERFIPPHTPSESRRDTRELFSYVPENSLIHKVTVFKQSTTYDFYADFCSTAEALWNTEGHECEYADFFSYSPQYDQLTEAQREYYLWWRTNFRNGNFIKTNLSYIYLYTFELINTADADNARYCRDMMLTVLLNYNKVLLGAKSKYIRWIADFGLIHRLNPPRNISEMLLRDAGALKEYFVRIPGNTYEGWAEMLLNYCCSYDYKASKFFVGENKEVYDVHVKGAIVEVVRKLSENGKILSGLPFDDCKIHSPAFEGALCSSANRYTIEVEYCSFSRSHELRFIIGDAVKYAENKIRGYLSIKSRLTVYSLPNDICDVINEYFSRALPMPRKLQVKNQKREEYEVFYDLPETALSLTNADRIEKESWGVTRELVEAFDIPEERNIPQLTVTELPKAIECVDNDIKAALGEYLAAVISLVGRDALPLKELARISERSLEGIIDAINEIAVDVIGDVIIVDDGDGYCVVEDYIEMLD